MTYFRKHLPVILAVVFSLSSLCLAEETSHPFRYEHDPMADPKAAKDIIENPEAVYGYSPSPDSVRLKEYADALDWTDDNAVAEARKQRQAYLDMDKTLFEKLEEMQDADCTMEEIARTLSKMRNEIRLASYDGDPDGLSRLKKSNFETYGNEEGPTPEYLFEKYGSWEVTALKVFSTNRGMDACLGFYDTNYEYYQLLDEMATGEDPDSSDHTYTVASGDSLWKIAREKLGEGTRWEEIYELNKNQISNPRLIYAGQDLLLPEV